MNTLVPSALSIVDSDTRLPAEGCGLGASPLPESQAPTEMPASTSMASTVAPTALARHATPEAGADASEMLVSGTNEALELTAVPVRLKMRTLPLSPVATSTPSASAAPPEAPVAARGLPVPSCRRNSMPDSGMAEE